MSYGLTQELSTQSFSLYRDDAPDDHRYRSSSETWLNQLLQLRDEFRSTMVMLISMPLWLALLLMLQLHTI